jgi:tetratricopeptide (TPR) repeat protein
LEQTAQYDPKLIAEAAEVYRRAGRFYKALTLNAGIRDQQVKLKQRLSVFIALKRYEQAANMKKSLYRNVLLNDQNIRYALAYAYFASGQFDAAGRQIDFLIESELFITSRSYNAGFLCREGCSHEAHSYSTQRMRAAFLVQKD